MAHTFLLSAFLSRPWNQTLCIFWCNYIC